MRIAMGKKKNLNRSSISKKENTATEELVVKRKGGGSIIRFKPVFSDDSSSVYIIWDNTIREYSTKTGQLVRTLDYPKTIEGESLVCLGFNPEEKSLIYACNNKSFLISWDKETGFLEDTTALATPQKEKILGFHFAKYKKRFYLIIKKHSKQGYGFLVYNPAKPGNKSPELLPITCQSGQHTFSFGGESHDEFLACITKCKLNIMDLKTGTSYEHGTTAERGFTCVASHKTEMCIATGDMAGRILIWRDFLVKKQKNLGKHVPYSVYHWHTLPVADIAFTQAASYFYSGAAECVLVKWGIDLESRQFLPRIGSPIVHLVVAPDNRFVAVSLEDNSIVLVDSRTQIVQAIQHMSLSLPAGSNSQHMSKADLVLDPHSKAIIVNSSVGHLQFFNVETQDLMFKLDIVGHNYLTRERNTAIINTDVTRVAITQDGKWLATVEEREDKETHIEVRLKFWKSHWLESFKLNTSVELPHQGAVQGLEFQPGQDEDEPPRAVSSGNDRRFCSWTLIDAISEKDADDNSSWACDGVGTYQNLQAGPTAFSSDGSLLGIAFEHAVTLWLPGTNELQSSLTHPETKSRIKHMQFGNAECCHLLVTASSYQLCVWDLLTLTLAWTVPLSITCMTSNPRNSHIAAFTKNELFIFKPSAEQPLFRHKLPEDTQAVSTVFWPYTGRKSKSIEWQQLAQLYFINEDQELMCLERAEDDGDVNDEVEGAVLPTGQYHQTAFSALLAKQSTSQVKDAKPPPIWEQQLKSSQGSYTQMLCTTPAHMLPPMEFIVRDLVQEYLEEQSGHTDTAPMKQEDIDMEDLSSDSDDEQVKRKPQVKFEEKNDSPVKTESSAEKTQALENAMSEDMNWVESFVKFKISTRK